MTTSILSFQQSGSAPFLERFTWNTDITVPISGVESSRRRKRTYPAIEYELTLEDAPSFNDQLLETVRSAPTTYLLPLWPHTIKPFIGPSVGVSIDPGQVFYFARPDGTYVANVPPGYNLPVSLPLPAPPNQLPRGAPYIPVPNVVSVTPTVPCVVSKTTSIRHVTTGHRQVQLTLRALGFRECPVPFYGPYDQGLPLLPDNWLEFSEAPTEAFDRTENSIEIGSQTLVDLHYIERTFTAVVTLVDPADQHAFRALIFALCGRYGAFRMLHPYDGTMRTWRLTSDAVELAHMPGGYLLAKITMKELT